MPVWTIWLAGLFYLCTLLLGFGAMRLVEGKRILAAPGGGDSAVPCSGLTITASASFAHDVYAGLVRHRGWRGKRWSCLTQDSAARVNAWTCR